MQVWQEAMRLAIQIHQLSSTLTSSEAYGPTSQIRRTTCSVHANIAEAFGRSTNPDQIRIYVFAKGSANETQSHLFYGQEVSYFDKNEVDTFLNNYKKVV